jgi:hypothetical protein
MHSCEHARSALAAIPGVQKVEVHLESGEAGIWYDPDKLVPQQFQIALFVMGFTLTASSGAESDVAPPPDLENAAQPVSPTAVIYDSRKAIWLEFRSESSRSEGEESLDHGCAYEPHGQSRNRRASER